MVITKWTHIKGVVGTVNGAKANLARTLLGPWQLFGPI
jgi:hypothetical protein